MNIPIIKFFIAIWVGGGLSCSFLCAETEVKPGHAHMGVVWRLAGIAAAGDVAGHKISSMLVAHRFLEHFAPDFVFSIDNYDDNVRRLLLRVWGKFDLIHSFHLSDEHRILFSQEIVDDLLLLYTLIRAGKQYDVAGFEQMRADLRERLALICQTCYEVFPIPLGDTVGAVRCVMRKLCDCINQ